MSNPSATPYIAPSEAPQQCPTHGLAAATRCGANPTHYWCDDCDGTHGPLCPWCAGRGYSTAPLLAIVGDDSGRVDFLTVWRLIDDSDLRAFVEGYAEALLWAGQDWSAVDDISEHNPRPIDENHSVDDISVPLWLEIIDECFAFISEETTSEALSEAMELGSPGYGWEGAGIDFYLTRNRHGAGFWDRGFGTVGAVLTAAAHPWGSTDEWCADGLVWHS